MPDTPAAIHERLKHARERAGLDPAELRTRLRDYDIDMSKTGLHRVETIEPRNPNLRLVKAIADITHVSPSWILFGEGPSLAPDAADDAIRDRLIDTIELLSGALTLSARQRNTIDNWLSSVRASPVKQKK
ncbi:MAG: helix-turn-helix transcriptional regulator [Pseudomonadota bacterium]